MKIRLVGLVVSLLLAVGANQMGLEAQAQARDVPYVPTPQHVVDEMLRVGQVDGNDRLYDLGSGDGRIVITAAKNFGTRGIGIDIDPQRIAESKANAESAGVTDLVRFEQGNLFEIDFSEATVVTLYLLPSVNLQLRSRLLNELKPGTRIVSHAFDMGEWPPQEQLNLDGYEIFYWVVPANVSGSWQVRVPETDQPLLLEFEQEFQEADGTITATGAPTTLQTVEIDGDRLHFTLDRAVGNLQPPVQFEGQVQGNVIEGRMISAEGASTWRATRDPATITGVDGAKLQI
jgi:precorrin-6B methylase 2